MNELATLLKGDKWWTVAEIANHFTIQEATVRSSIARYRKRFNIVSVADNSSRYTIKYFRINPQ